MKYCMAILLFLVSMNTHAALTKWVDEHGKVHYSDSPPPEDVKSETVRITPPPKGAVWSTGTASSAPPPAKTIFEKEADLKKERKAKEEAAQKAAEEKQAAEAKQKNCEQARIQLQTLQNSPRVMVYDEKGERSVLDDAGRQKRTDDAQEAIGRFCN